MKRLQAHVPLKNLIRTACQVLQLLYVFFN